MATPHLPTPSLPVEVPAADLQTDPHGLLIKETDTELTLGIPAGGAGTRVGATAAFIGAATMATLTLTMPFVLPAAAALMIGSMAGVLALVLGTVGKRLWGKSDSYHWLFVKGDEVSMIVQTMDGAPHEETLGHAWAPEVRERRVHNVHHKTNHLVADVVFQSEKGERILWTDHADDVTFHQRLLHLITPHLNKARPAHLPPPRDEAQMDTADPDVPSVTSRSE